MAWVITLFLWLVASITTAVAETPTVCAPAAPLTYDIVRKIPRAAPAFTQGLLFSNGYLYESSGLYGHSALDRLDLRNGDVTSLLHLDPAIFAEGLEKWDETFALLTWKEGKILVWNDGFEAAPQQFAYPYAGWGLAHDSSQWIASDGTDALHFLDRETFREVRTVHVRLGSDSVADLNELEEVKGSVYANIFQTNQIYKINPENGCVQATLDLSALRALIPRAELKKIEADSNSVLNGIAYDATADVFYVTGKNWPAIFELRIEGTQPAPRVTLSEKEVRLRARASDGGPGSRS